MLSYLHSYFTTINHDQSHGHDKKNESKHIYRDQLDKNVRSSSKLRRRAHHKTAEAKLPLLQRENDKAERKRGETKIIIEEKKEIRVKVRLTKEEAKRLLSKCKKGGLLKFSDVTHELNKIPAKRITVVDPSTIVRDHEIHSIAEKA